MKNTVPIYHENRTLLVTDSVYSWVQFKEVVRSVKRGLSCKMM